MSEREGVRSERRGDDDEGVSSLAQIYQADRSGQRGGGGEGLKFF